MKVSVQSTTGRNYGDFQLPENATLESLQRAFQKAHPKYYPDRQRFYPYYSPLSSTTTKRPPPLQSHSPLADGAKFIFKDLGPQILWKTVFLLEYFGPLLLYPIFYMQPRWIYGSAVDIPISAWAKEVQFSALITWSIHYTKRELETLFVHRFSHATMPLSNLFKNCIYYWGFAAYVAYFVNHPKYTPPSSDLVYGGMCLFYFMEVGNLSAHWTLRMLRPPGTKVRRIPRGGLFEFVSCPNYTYEILAWVGFNLMTKTVAGILFMCMGAFQMVAWAQGKHRRYRKEFDGEDGRLLYPPNRKIIIPFLY